MGLLVYFSFREPQCMKEECKVKVGDFLLSRANTYELVGRSVVVEESYPNLMMSDKLVRLNLAKDVDRQFCNLFNNSGFARAYYSAVAGGTRSSMKNISRMQIMNLRLPLHPQKEQKRIVAKVDELMALCNELKKKLEFGTKLKSTIALTLSAETAKTYESVKSERDLASVR